MVTFAKNPYDWVDDSEVNSAVLKFDMTYKGAPILLNLPPGNSGVSHRYRHALRKLQL